MKYIKIQESVLIEQLYVKVSCPDCEQTYRFHILKPNHARVCPCARGTYYFTVEPYKNYIGIGVVWVGRWEQRVPMDVNSIEVAKIEDVPTYTREEIDQEG